MSICFACGRDCPPTDPCPCPQSHVCRHVAPVVDVTGECVTCHKLVAMPTPHPFGGPFLDISATRRWAALGRVERHPVELTTFCTEDDDEATP